MEIRTHRQEDFAVVSVKGRVVRENQGELRKALEETLSGTLRGIALDFRGVDYIDSAGLGACAATSRLLQDRACGRLVMFGASPNIERMWKLIRLELVIPFFTTESEALECLRSPSSNGKPSA